MLLKAKLTVLLTVFSCVFLYAQDWNNYQPIQSEGQIPKEFLSSSTEKFISKVESISSEKKRREQRKEEQFYLQSTFNIDQLLLSGNVLFNDPISIYVNKVADELLKNNAGLRKKLKFYVVKSPISNAFATERGAIFINMGLLARLENEAQLAFILSHEITHYTKDHVLKRYINNRDMTDKRSKNYKQYKKSSGYEVLLAKYNYSKKNEKEADRVGLGASHFVAIN
ncbi:MAG: putative Zn-dependent protease [Bacteroidia bacterium]|jgi:predicted Zn-dependent protease